ncbi:hypothetical protein WA158_005287 [Blastocystis sp. Blastoise]
MSAQLVVKPIEKMEEPIIIKKSLKSTSNKPRRNVVVTSPPPIRRNRRVSFNLDEDVVDFNQNLPPLLTYHRKPSTVGKLNSDQIYNEAVSLQLPVKNSGYSDEKLQELILHKWCKLMIKEMDPFDLHINNKQDSNTIEQQYNLFKSIMRGSILNLYELSLYPQECSKEELQRIIETKNIKTKHNDREEMIQALETYYLQTLPRMEQSNYEFSKIFFSPREYFQEKYKNNSPSDLSREIEKYGEKAPKKIETRKETLITLIEKNMKNRLYDSFKETLQKCLKYRLLDIEGDMKTLFMRLYTYKIDNKETILDE